MRQLGEWKSYRVVDDVKSILIIFLGMILCRGYVKTGPYLLKWISGWNEWMSMLCFTALQKEKFKYDGG